MTTLLCLASYFKGTRFLQAAKEAGATVYLLTREKLHDEAWPAAAIDERFLMPTLRDVPAVVNAVSYLFQEHNIDQIVPLDDYDVPTVAALREHLRLPGMGETVTRYFRDKLAMRQQAAANGIPVPAFASVFNRPKLSAWMESNPAPWLLKPRQEAGAMGIQRCESPQDVWDALNQLGDEQSHFLLERFLPGDVYHVDSVVQDGVVIFANVSVYGRPPIDVAHGGGVFMSSTLDRSDPLHTQLLELNRQHIKAFGMSHGVTHAEFLRTHATGDIVFIETAARVGGANLDKLVEMSSGLNLWQAWAELEIAQLRGDTYQLPQLEQDYAGILVCLARQEYPNYAAYDDPEIVWRLHKKQHAGLIVRSDSPQRVQQLLDRYAQRFVRDFVAVAPPLERAPD